MLRMPTHTQVVAAPQVSRNQGYKDIQVRGMAWSKGLEALKQSRADEKPFQPPPGTQGRQGSRNQRRKGTRDSKDIHGYTGLPQRKCKKPHASAPEPTTSLIQSNH